MKINLTDIPVAYINRSTYPNRNLSMKSMLDFIGFSYTRVEGVIAEDYDGISDAHINAAKIFDQPPFIILEDDCMVYHWRPEIEVPDDADIVYLGVHASKLKKSPTEYDGLWKSSGMYGAHAILYLTKNGLGLLNEARKMTKEKKIRFDEAFYKIHSDGNVYVLDSPIWFQRDVPRQTAFTISGVNDKIFTEGGGYEDYAYPIVFRGY